MQNRKTETKTEKAEKRLKAKTKMFIYAAYITIIIELIHSLSAIKIT